MILFDFECPKCLLVFEELVHRDTLLQECPDCGHENAVRLISAPRVDPRLGLSDDFPTAVAKWEKTRRQHHSKRNDNEE